ncbi:hypothetical protein SAMN05216428_102154 [Nitrosospira sp. Nsp11]|nr:hypothetical protein SAMN05216428_102154 [Nitrosospira sp. Nsp11]
MQKLVSPTICELIDVQPPHFAFNDLTELSTVFVRDASNTERQACHG